MLQKNDLGNARIELDKKLTKLLPDVQKVRSLVDVDWRAPGRIQGPLDNLEREVNLLEQDLIERNAKAANNKNENEVPKYLAELVNTIGKYGTNLGEYSYALSQAKLPVSELMQKQLADAAALVIKTFPSPWSDKEKETVDEAKVFLTKIYGDAAACRTIVKSLQQEAHVFAEWSGKQLQIQADSQALQNLIKATQNNLNISTIDSDLDGGAFQIIEVQERCKALREAWVTFSLSVAQNAKPEEIHPLILAGNWQGLVELLKNPNAGAGVALDAGAERPNVAKGGPPSSAIVIGHTVPEWSPSIVRIGTADLDGSEGEVYLLNKQIWYYELIQTIIVGIIFAVGVFALYEDAWLGTYKEMLAIFILAFNVDLTTDGVISKLKQ